MTVSVVSSAPSRSRKRALLVSATALLAAALVTAPFRADGAPSPGETPMCFGKPATIVADGYTGGHITHEHGTPKADVIVISDLALSVDAGKGADRVCGAGPTVNVKGGPGNDRLETGSGGGTLRGDAGNDVLREASRCCGGDLLGGDGADLVIGDYILSGGEGDDVLRWTRLPAGGDKLDRVTVPARFRLSPGQMKGDDGDDKVFGGDGRDDMFGGGGEDQLSGKAGNDSILGGDDDDLLRGGTGDDRLDGGLDNDDCRGEAGTDSAVNCEALSEVP